MLVLFTNNGYITRKGFSDNLHKAQRFIGRKTALKKAVKVMRTGKVNFIDLYTIH